MSKIFISHSSLDNGSAIAIAEWLQENGWDEYFLDLEPERGIAAGERWERALHQAVNRCEAVLLLISRNWLASPWCLREMELAYKLNKHIFGVLIDDTPRAIVPKTILPWQMANLHRGQDHTLIEVHLPDQTLAQVTFSRAGLATLKEGLRRTQIDPKHFTWPPESEPDRAPWRGLEPLESRDAGIFFGRDGQIIGALDKIRALREAAPPRLMAIIGASGAGKSSFLRAGLIPRLERDDHNYLVLPVIRPEGGALKALTASLGQAAIDLKFGLAQHDIKQAVSQAAKGNSKDLSTLLTRMAETARPPMIDGEAAPPPAIVLPIDQGEELFHSSGRAEGSTFLSLLARLLRLDQPRLLALVTIRSDSYDLLQRARELEEIRHEAFSLPPLTRGNYADVIRRPLEVLNRHLGNSGHSLKFDPAIIERLTATLDEGAGRDALPLLAFTLARLYRDFHAGGHITVADYDAMGGISGSIDAAVDSALARAAEDRRTSHGAALADMLRQTMIPRFAGIDPETGTARRRAASYDALPAEALPLVDALIAERLLTRDNGTVEPAHEALLREWKALTQWLAEDREQLITLEGVRRAAADWQANGRHKDYLAHREGRLASAEGLQQRPDIWGGLGDTDRAYLRASREAENAARASRERIIRVSAIVVGLFFLATLGAAWFASDRHRTAQNNFRAAQQAEADALALLALSRAESDPVSALKLVLGSWPDTEDGTFPKPSIAFQAISTALTRTRPHTLVDTHRAMSDDEKLERALSEASEEINLDEDIAYAVAFSSVGALVAGGYDNGALQLWNADTGKKFGDQMLGYQGAVSSVAFSPDGTRIISGHDDGTLQLWDTATRSRVGDPIRRHVTSVTSIAFPVDNSTKISTGDSSGNVGFWDIDATGLKQAHFETLHEADASVTSLSFSHDGTRLVSGDSNGELRIVNTTTYRKIDGKRITINGKCDACDMSPDRVADPATRRCIPRLECSVGDHATGGAITSITFSRDGKAAISGHEDGTVRRWDTTTGNLLGKSINTDKNMGGFIALSRDGHLAAQCDELGEIYIWDTKTKLTVSQIMNKNEKYCLDLFLSQDGKHLISLYDDGNLRLWDAQTGSLIAESTDEDVGESARSDLGEPVSALTLTPNKNKIIVGYPSGSLWVFHKNEASLQADSPLHGHDGEIQSLFTSSNGTDIISIGVDNHDFANWQMRSADSGEPIGQSRRAHVGSTFSPDGTRFVNGSEDGTLYLWDTMTAGSKPILGHKAEIGGIIFSPDSTLFASHDWAGTLRIWGVDGQERTLEAISQDDCLIDSFAFSNNSKQFACSGEDGTFRIWNTDPIMLIGESIYSLNEEEGRTSPATFSSTAFSPDGKRIASANELGELLLFDTETRTQIGNNIRRNNFHLTDIIFSSDGARIVTGNSVGAIRLWDISYPPGNILQIACHYRPVIDGHPDTSTDGLTAGIVNRDLTLPTDCDSYNPPLPPEYRR